LLQTTMAEIVGFMKEQMAAIAVTAETEAAMAQYVQLLDATVLAIPDMAAGIICLFGSVAGILSVVCFFAFTRKHREALGIPAPKPFRLWSIPRAWTKGIMFLYVLAFVLMIADYANAAAVHNTVMQLLSVPLIVQGLAMIAFLLSMRKYPSKSLNAVIFTAIGVLFAIVQSMLTMIGLFEQVMRMRERVIVLRKD